MCFDCKFTSPQLQRLVDHVNTHRDDIDDGGLLWAELITQAQLKVHWCVCGLLFPDTQHGREKHLRTYEGASAEVATSAASAGKAATNPHFLALLLASRRSPWA